MAKKCARLNHQAMHIIKDRMTNESLLSWRRCPRRLITLPHR